MLDLDPDDVAAMRTGLRYLSVEELLELRSALVFELTARGCSDLIGPERSEGPRLSTLHTLPARAPGAGS